MRRAGPMAITGLQTQKEPRIVVFLRCTSTADFGEISRSHRVVVNETRGTVRTAYLPIGSVDALSEHPDVVLTRAIETPKRPEVRFHDIITVALGDHGEISHVIDDSGDATAMHPRVTPKVTNFP